MYWHEVFALFILLSLSLALAILANRETGVVRTTGFTLAACLVILSILFIAAEAGSGPGGGIVSGKTRPPALHRAQMALEK